MNSAMLRMLAGMSDNDSSEDTPSDQMQCSVDGAVARLREVQARVEQGNPYKLGDLVTPRLSFNIKGNGVPHLVVMTREPGPMIAGEASIGSCNQAVPVDTYALCISRGDIVGFWLCSWALEPFSGA